MPKPRNKAWQERFIRSAYFLGAILLHLIVFVLVATLVIFKAPEPPPNDVFHGVSVKVPPSPIQPPSSGATAANAQFEPQPVVIPVVAPPTVITVDNSSFKIDAPKVLDQALSHLSNQMPQGTGLSTAGGGLSGGQGNAFGSSTGASNQLTGYFYDLKQTGNKSPTNIDVSSYGALLLKYVSQGWDESLFSSYYKSKIPLYTDSLAISTRSSEEGPKAFNLQNEVQSGLWIVHYHAKVAAPQPGEYRFAGFGDNILMVRINGENVLDAGFGPLTDKAVLHQALPFAFPRYAPFASIADPHLRVGKTFRIEAAEIVDMDVLIGDDGGMCGFFLLIQNIKTAYETAPDGTPKLPFFQLNSDAAPIFSSDEESPPYSTKTEPWQAVTN